jgi:phage FluMu protein Com
LREVACHVIVVRSVEQPPSPDVDFVRCPKCDAAAATGLSVSTQAVIVRCGECGTLWQIDERRKAARESRRSTKFPLGLDQQQGLAVKIESEGRRSESFELWATTTVDGRIMTGSDALARLLNFAPSSLRGRDIYLHVGDGRDALRRAIAHVADEFGLERDVVIRPRDRKPVAMRVIVQRQPNASLLWALSLRRQ